MEQRQQTPVEPNDHGLQRENDQLRLNLNQLEHLLSTKNQETEAHLTII